MRTSPLPSGPPSFLLHCHPRLPRGKRLGGFADPIDVHVYRALAEFTPLSRDAEHLNLLYAGQRVFNSRENGVLGWSGGFSDRKG
jgi:hypothetical protein